MERSEPSVYADFLEERRCGKAGKDVKEEKSVMRVVYRRQRSELERHVTSAFSITMNVGRSHWWRGPWIAASACNALKTFHRPCPRDPRRRH